MRIVDLKNAWSKLWGSGNWVTVVYIKGLYTINLGMLRTINVFRHKEASSQFCALKMEFTSLLSMSIFNEEKRLQALCCILQVLSFCYMP